MAAVCHTVGTSNAEAQSLYLIAKARLREGNTFGSDTELNPQHLRSARRLLEEVVRLDPKYAEAWAALAVPRNKAEANRPWAGEGRLFGGAGPVTDWTGGGANKQVFHANQLCWYHYKPYV